MIIARPSACALKIPRCLATPLPFWVFYIIGGKKITHPSIRAVNASRGPASSKHSRFALPSVLLEGSCCCFIEFLSLAPHYATP
jgi:hypothetical protein